MPSGWRIGRIAGIDIRVDPSWFIIALLITINMWSIFTDPRRFPDLGRTAGAVLAISTAVLLFASILAHELAHALVSLARHIPVLGITLWMFGGFTHAKVESRSPMDEFLVTAAGPATSLGLGGLFVLLRPLGGSSTESPLALMFVYLGFINLTLGIFNLLPGFPLDGGRLLRSAIWRITGSLSRATRIAAMSGQGIALLIAAVGLFLVVRDGDVSRIWTVLIGWFLFTAATAVLKDADRKARLERARARELMSPPPPTIPASLSIGEARERFLDGHEGEAFPVIADGGVAGFVSLGSAAGHPADSAVSDAMVEPSGTIQVGPDEPMDAVVSRLGDDPGATVLVMDEGALVGVIEPEDLMRDLASDAEVRST